MTDREDIDTAAVRARTLANFRAGASGDMAAMDIAVLCDALDEARAEVKFKLNALRSWRFRAEKAEYNLTAARRSLAAVEALANSWNEHDALSLATEILAAISDPGGE